MRQRLMVLGAIATGLALPASAGAAGPGTQDLIAIPGPATSLAQTADGSIWATLGTRRTVLRISPDGTQTESADLGGSTSGVAVGGGKVWVAVTSAKKVVAIDPANLGDTRSTATPSNSCGPVALTAGDDGVFASLPNNGSGSADCPAPATPSAIMAISAAGVPGAAQSGRGTAYRLLFTGGKLWVPDFDGGVVRRLSPDLTTEATFDAGAGSGPQGLALAPDGTVTAALFNASSVSRIPATAGSGAFSVFATQVPSASSVATVGSSLYVMGSAVGGGAPVINRVVYDGSATPTIPVPAGAVPFDVTAGPDGTAWITDLSSARLIRITSRAPRVTTGDLGPTPAIFPADPSATAASLTVNPGGNATSVSIEYGATGYTDTVSAGTAQGTTDQTLTARLTGLQPATRYFYRAVASSPEGTTYGAERTFVNIARQTTPPSQEPEPAQASAPEITLTRSTKHGLRVSKIRVTGLSGGEKIAVTCTGGGCPRKKNDRTYGTGAKKAGNLTVKASKITAAKLRKGAKVTVVVSKKGATTVTAIATATTSKKLTVKTRCKAAGAKVSSVC